VHVALLLAVAGLVYWSAWTLGLLLSGMLPDNLTALEFLMTDLRAMDFGVFGEPVTLAVFGALVIAAAAAAFLFDPSLLWAGILAAASAVAVFAPVVSAIWAGHWASETLLVWLAVAVGMLIFGIVGVVLAAPVHIGMLGLFQAATRRVRPPGHNWATLRTSMEDSCGYALALLSIWYSLRWVLLLWAILTAMAAAGFWIQSKISGPITAALSSFGARFESVGARIESLGVQVPLPFAPLANGLIIAAAVLTLLVLILIVLRALWTRSLEPLRSIPSTLAMAFSLAMMGLLIWISTRVDASAVNLICLRTLLVIFSLPLLAVLLFLLWNVIERIRFARFLRSRKSPPGSSNPEDWKSRFNELTTEQQHDSLLRTDHQSLSLTASEFLEVLKEIETSVKGEPAVSTYWAQRDQLEEVLRQERQG
jgi:hypothetical protein